MTKDAGFGAFGVHGCAGVHFGVEVELGKEHVSGFAAYASVGLLRSNGHRRYGGGEVGHGGVKELLAVVGGADGASGGVFVNPGPVAEKVDHADRKSVV